MRGGSTAVVFERSLPTGSEPANSQFARPIAQERIWFSTQLVSIGASVVKVACQCLPALEAAVDGTRCRRIPAPL